MGAMPLWCRALAAVLFSLAIANIWLLVQLLFALRELCLVLSLGR